MLERQNLSALGVPEFPEHLKGELNRVQRLTRRFRVVPGGEVKPRLDWGSKGTASYHDQDHGDRWPVRIAAESKRHATEMYLKLKEEDALTLDQSEITLEIKPEEKIVELDLDSKVIPLRIKPGLAAWQLV